MTEQDLKNTKNRVIEEFIIHYGLMTSFEQILT